MSSSDYLRNGWIRPHERRAREVQQLLAIVARDLEQSQVPGLGPEWRFDIAYNAVLQAGVAALAPPAASDPSAAASTCERWRAWSSRSGLRRTSSPSWMSVVESDTGPCTNKPDRSHPRKPRSSSRSQRAWSAA